MVLWEPPAAHALCPRCAGWLQRDSLQRVWLACDVQAGTVDLAVLEGLRSVRCRRLQASSGSGSDGDDDEDLADGYGEEDGALGEDVEVQDVQLSKLVRRLQGGDQGSNSDDTSDWEWEEEAEVFSCPLDDIDAFVQLADCMEAMRGLHPARFEALTGKPELQGALQEVSLYADKRRQEIAAEKAAEQEEEAKKQAKRMAGQMPPAGQ